ncbi:hypothetical protein TREMEDRAFT_27838 [Tremella mesenterica DSM 1558]|uniref:uncharacterized protein n=1 Tax=Tremella mesenterica (strain ATCC 24925 / CBS 8224 / DSM 1558 / NBRC 9311 / NRRL Y-6157 / RJB 2259-6 / UBC 559-6) TaxID=578456 RepID=UPI0003F493C6|nr:uncharacterized protein TREMEDRAFT_27838 [Tremella mesenterica DSM 1558]EIW71580.1 hypothetical protein TREMEDRAFT_27838 [Tremella mesenterica DSM 1558]
MYYPLTTFISLPPPTYRPRRRLSPTNYGQLSRRRILPILLALSIPILTLLLVRELSLHHTLRKAGQHQAWLGESTDLVVLRREYERKRRKELSSLTKKKRWRREEGFRQSQRDGEETAEGEREEERLRREVEDWWPVWWGNRDEVGKSPWDHTPIEGRKRRVLFLTDVMNTHTYELVDAALRHPNVIVDVWGPKWAGWNSSLPLSANIKRRQRRIAQLETSKRIWESEKQMEEERRKRKDRGWWFGFGDPGRPPGIEEEEESQQEWVKPPWITEDENEEGEQACGEVVFDIAWTISDIFKQKDPLVDVLECGTLLVQQLGDCHSLRCMLEWYPQANNITLSKYAFELQEVFEYERVRKEFPNWEMGLFGHNPDTGNEWDFYPMPWMNKTVDAKMFGFESSFYPIRTTVSDQLHRQEEDPSILPSPIVRHLHPGYFIWPPEEARKVPLETYQRNHTYYAEHRRLRADFATRLRETRICVFDASLERKMIRKYAQAFLSGCVVAADLPTEQESALKRFTIPLKPSWPIERIDEELRRYLDRPERLHQMALDAFAYARKELTTTRKISDVLDMADAYRAGVRGYEHPHSFSLRCRAYWSGDAYRPPWCKEDHFRGLEG